MILDGAARREALVNVIDNHVIIVSPPNRVRGICLIVPTRAGAIHGDYHHIVGRERRIRTDGVYGRELRWVGGQELGDRPDGVIGWIGSVNEVGSASPVQAIACVAQTRRGRVVGLGTIHDGAPADVRLLCVGER